MNMLGALLRGRIGLRVKMKTGAQYTDSQVYIAAGTLGTTESATCAGAIVGVKWDGRSDVLDTRFDQLEVLDPTVA